MSYLLTRKIAERAVKFVLPSIQMLMDVETFTRKDLHIAISNPTAVHTERAQLEPWCENCLLYEHSIGDPAKWEMTFDRFARSKCFIAWRLQMPTWKVLAEYKYLLQPGDCRYDGGVVDRGLAVGVSGQKPYYDRMIAEWIISACKALCTAEALTKLTDAEAPTGFIPKIE